MRKLPDIVIEQSLQASGWHRDYDNEWVNPDSHLSFKSTEEVLHHEWWNALGRASKAEERNRGFRSRLIDAWICAFANLGFAVVLLLSYLRSR